jgi:hypothetical protein
MAKKKASPILGHWRITHMDMWDQSFVDAEVEGYVRFDLDDDGEFQFGYVHGWMTCEQTERDGKPAVEWSWEGNDEMHPASGRGWAVYQDDGTLGGKLFFHGGDTSGFTATKVAGKKPQAKKRKMRAIDVKTGKTVEVDADAIKSGRIKHSSLPDPLLKRIRAIHAALKGVYDLPLEQMEINFMRDSNPEGEVALWERLVVGFEKVTRTFPDLERKMVLRIVLGYSMSALTPAEKADPVVKKIIKIAEGK